MWADCGDEVTRVQVICLRMRGELFQFYQRWKQEHRNEPLTELTDFSPNMIGTSQAPKLTTKASETWGLLLFLLSFIEGHQASFRNESISVLCDAGMQLKQIVYKLKTHDNVVVDLILYRSCYTILSSTRLLWSPSGYTHRKCI